MKAFKRLEEKVWNPQDELELELAVLDFIEQASYAFLTSEGVASLEQQYLIGFAKRAWELALKFSGTTYTQSLSLLVSEYITRGHVLLEDATILGGLEAIVDDAATSKKARLVIDFSVFVGVMT